MKTLWPGTEPLTNLQRAEKLESLARELLALRDEKTAAWADDFFAMSMDLMTKAGKIEERTITQSECERLKEVLARTNIDQRSILKKYHCTRWGTMQIKHYREAIENLTMIAEGGK